MLINNLTERKKSMKTRTKKYPTTDTFKFVNRNPKGCITTGDCVYRAISEATGKSWCDIVHDLADLACEISRCPNGKTCYGEYLERNGFKKCKQPRHDDGTKYTVREFCLEHKTGTFVVGIAGHLTAVKNGKCHDTWDCSKCSTRVGNYWRKSK